MLTRKQFLRSAAGVCAASFGLVVLGCGTSLPAEVDAAGPLPGRDGGAGDASRPDADGGMASRCVEDGTAVVIGSNHGHILVVTKAEVAAGVEKTYDIQGTSNHPHTVVLTAAMFQQLQADQAIVTTSSFDDDHDHSIMVACA
jgi:hypothetical protein